MCILGDFHFLWECLKVIMEIYWGKASQHGSLCNLKEVINQKQVEKKAKNFCTCDEFILHVFKCHMIAAICDIMKLEGPNSNIPHQPTLQWLEDTAKFIVQSTIMPKSSQDKLYACHRSFLHTAFLYIDLRNAIRFEDGPHIIRRWLIYFLACDKSNCASEAANLICKLKADLPKHLAYVAIHNRTVNTTGRLGQGKPIDQLNKHYNL